MPVSCLGGRSDGAVFAIFQQFWGGYIRTMYIVHGLLPLGANIVIFECIVHKAINPVCNTCITNAGLLPVVEKRKGSFFSVRKWRTEKGNGKFLAEWFHISPWEVPNFRTSSEVGVERALGVWWSRWTRRAWKRA